MAAPRPIAAPPRARATRGFGAFSRFVAVASLAAAALRPAPASTQVWAAAVDGGRATFDLGSREIETSNLVLSVTHARPRIWFGGSVSPALADDDPLWGGAWIAALPQARRGPWRWAANLGAQLYGQDDPSGQASGLGAGAEAVPQVSYDGIPAFELGLAAGAQVYYSGFGAESTAFTRTVGVAEGFAMLTPQGSPLELLGTVRHLFAEEDGYTLLEASAQVVEDRFAAWVSGGTWLNEFIDTTPWEVGAALRVLDRAWIRAVARREAFDPVYLADARTSWSVGATVRLGPTVRGAVEAVADVPAPIQSATTTELTVRAGAVQGPVSVAGDFNGWQPVTMTLEGDRWVHRPELAPGVYRYAFVDGGGTWFVPEGTPGRAPDGMGGWVAVLIVDD